MTFIETYKKSYTLEHTLWHYEKTLHGESNYNIIMARKGLQGFYTESPLENWIYEFKLRSIITNASYWIVFGDYNFYIINSEATRSPIL